MGGGGDQGISEQVHWEKGKKKALLVKRGILELISLGKKGSMSTLSNYEFSQNRSYFSIF